MAEKYPTEEQNKILCNNCEKETNEPVKMKCYHILCLDCAEGVGKSIYFCPLKGCKKAICKEDLGICYKPMKESKQGQEELSEEKGKTPVQNIRSPFRATFEYKGFERKENMQNFFTDDIINNLSGDDIINKNCVGFYIHPDEAKLIFDVNTNRETEVRERLNSIPKVRDCYEIVEQKKLDCRYQQLFSLDSYVTFERTGTQTKKRTGSLCCIGKEGDQYYIITCQHVLSDEALCELNDVDFKGYRNGEETVVGHNAKGVQGFIDMSDEKRMVDIAAITVLPNVICEPELRGLNDYYSGSDDKLYHCLVSKCGASTNQTRGRIINTGYYTKPSTHDKYLSKSFIIESNEPNDVTGAKFAQEGDTGSLIWTATGVPIGILTGVMKDYKLNGYVKDVYVAARLDASFHALEQIHNIHIQSLFSYETPALALPFISNLDNLLTLAPRELVHENTIDLQDVNIIKLINNEIWCCRDKCVDKYDQHLKFLTKLNLPNDLQRITKIHSVMGVPRTNNVIFAGNGLFQCTHTGELEDTLEDDIWFTDVTWANANLYAAGKDRVIRIYYQQTNPRVWRRFNQISVEGSVDYDHVTLSFVQEELYIGLLDTRAVYVFSQEAKGKWVKVNSYQENSDGGNNISFMPRICSAENYDFVLVADEQNQRFVVLKNGRWNDVRFRIDKKYNISYPSSALYWKGNMYVACLNKPKLMRFKRQ